MNCNEIVHKFQTQNCGLMFISYKYAHKYCWSFSQNIKPEHFNSGNQWTNDVIVLWRTKTTNYNFYHQYFKNIFLRC